MIAKLILEYNSQIDKIRVRLNSHKEHLTELEENIDSLEKAVSAVPAISDLVRDKIDNLHDAVRRRRCFVEDNTLELDAITNAKKYFISCCREVCEHEWVESSYDGHRGEQNYKCKICGKYS